MGDRRGISAAHQRGERGLLDRLIELADRIRARLAGCCESEGVSASRFAVLQAIADGSEQGCSQTDLARELALSESNICALVERMREAGLLFRFRSKTDRRKSVLMLSERGRQLAQAIRRLQQIESETLLAVLDEQRRAELASLLEQLYDQLEATLPPVVDAVNEESGEDWEPCTSRAAQTQSTAQRDLRRAS